MLPVSPSELDQGLRNVVIPNKCLLKFNYIFALSPLYFHGTWNPLLEASAHLFNDIRHVADFRGGPCFFFEPFESVVAICIVINDGLVKSPIALSRSLRVQEIIVNEIVLIFVYTVYLLFRVAALLLKMLVNTRSDGLPEIKLLNFLQDNIQ